MFPLRNLTRISGLEATKPKFLKFKLTKKGEGFKRLKDLYNDIASNLYFDLNLWEGTT